jgi:hypothetical protein
VELNSRQKTTILGNLTQHLGRIAIKGEPLLRFDRARSSRGLGSCTVPPSRERGQLCGRVSPLCHGEWAGGEWPTQAICWLVWGGSTAGRSFFPQLVRVFLQFTQTQSPRAFRIALPSEEGCSNCRVFSTQVEDCPQMRRKFGPAPLSGQSSLSTSGVKKKFGWRSGSPLRCKQ